MKIASLKNYPFAPLLTIPVIGGIFAVLAMLFGSLNFSKQAMEDERSETYTSVETDRFGLSLIHI